MKCAQTAGQVHGRGALVDLDWRAELDHLFPGRDAKAQIARNGGDLRGEPGHDVWIRESVVDAQRPAFVLDDDPWNVARELDGAVRRDRDAIGETRHLDSRDRSFHRRRDLEAMISDAPRVIETDEAAGVPRAASGNRHDLNAACSGELIDHETRR